MCRPTYVISYFLDYFLNSSRHIHSDNTGYCTATCYMYWWSITLKSKFLNCREAKSVANSFWISIFDFDYNFRRKHSPIFQSSRKQGMMNFIGDSTFINRIVKIFIAGNTFIAEGLDCTDLTSRIYLKTLWTLKILR